ncbi:MAG: hypothetical protein CMP86_15355 [Gammaproteobacteria bacterium]|nr:hypothetical protein [Gammaproteobacteria bacterium]
MRPNRTNNKQWEMGWTGRFVSVAGSIRSLQLDAEASERSVESSSDLTKHRLACIDRFMQNLANDESTGGRAP